MSGRLSKFTTAKDMLNSSSSSNAGGGGGGRQPWKVLVPFPSGDSVNFTSKHMTRVNYKASTVPMDKELEIVGLAHSLRIAKGLQPPDRLNLAFSVDKDEVDGSTTTLQGPTIQAVSPGKSISLKYFRAMTIKKTETVRDCSCGPDHVVGEPWQPRCWQDGTEDQTKEVESFYAVLYDGFKIVFVNPGLECVFLARDVLDPQQAGLLPGFPAPLQRSLAMPLQQPAPPVRKARMSIPAAPAKASAERKRQAPAAAAAAASRPKYLDPHDSDADLFDDDDEEVAEARALGDSRDDTVILEMTNNGLRKAPPKATPAAAKKPKASMY